MKIGLQLYTVRDSYNTQEEFKETLKKVKELGYEGVEFAGFAGMEAEDLKAYLNELSLEPISSHHSLNDLESKLDELIHYNKTLGTKYIICAYAPAENPEEVEHILSVMGNAKSKAAESGLELLYHNHSHEFKKTSDKTVPLDRIGECCNLELDTYWAFHAEVEPCSYIRKNAEKIALIHLKDGSFEGHPCAIGEGFNNIKGILAMAGMTSKEWIIVENDLPAPEGLSDVERSIRYLSNLL